MPGVVGIIAPNRQDTLETWIRNMIQPLRRQEWYRVEKRVTQRAAFGCIALDDEVGFAEKDNTILVATGEIYGREELRAKLLEAGDPSASQYKLGELLLRLYLRFGCSALCNLNGIYVIAVWEDAGQKLTIINDRYGFGKLYYWMNGDQFLFASECKAIIWHPAFHKTINEVALADFLGVNYCLDDRTLFAGIQVIPQAAVLTYESGSVSLHRYWDYSFHSQQSNAMREDDYADQYYFHVQEAVRKQARENMGLQVTGGLDSRCLAGVLSQSVQPSGVRAVTIGEPGANDIEAGKAIAQSAGYTHTALFVGSDCLARYADEAVARLEGSVNCSTSWIFALDPFLQENKIQYAMNGFLGGTLTGTNLIASLCREAPTAQALQVLHRSFFQTIFREEDLAKLLKPTIYRNVKGESFNSIRRTYEAAPTGSLINRMIYCDLHQRQRRFIATHINVLSEFSRVLDPFAENQLLDFALTVPPELKIDQRFYKRMIVEHLPQVASVPYSKTGLPLNASPRHIRFQQLSVRIKKRLNKQLFSRLNLAKLSFPNERASFDFNQWLRTGSRSYVAQILNQKELLEDYFNVEKVDSLVADHWEGKRNDYQKICAIVTFALWRKQFAI
ncbi:MAG: hypothetical protein DCC55_08390 [Chloroflexi bacterium]|nr:MAG: hypothetical protein DCC55_08390 [Chloroflexota bacterium]